MTADIIDFPKRRAQSPQHAHTVLKSALRRTHNLCGSFGRFIDSQHRSPAELAFCATAMADLFERSARELRQANAMLLR